MSNEPGLTAGRLSDFAFLTSLPAHRGAGWPRFVSRRKATVADLIKYTKFSLFLRGQLLAEAQSCDINHTGGWQDIITIEKGLSGFSPGAQMCTIKIDSAVPRAGVEFDFRQAMQDGEILEVVCFRGSKKVKTKGIIKDVSETGGADKPSTMSINMTCSPVEESTL